MLQSNQLKSESIQHIGSYHPITTKIITVLQKGKPGDTYSDLELSKVAGANVAVGESGYGYLMSAIKYCESDGIVWQRAKKENKIVCLNGMEIVERSHNDLKSINRRVKRSGNRIKHVDPSTLPQDVRPQATALAAQLGAIGLMSKSDSTRKLIGNNQSAPQIEDAFRIFEKN